MKMTAMTRPWLLAAVVTLSALGWSQAALADYHVRSPDEIDQGELEVEHNGATTLDRDPTKGGSTSYTAEFGTGLTDWWHPELEFDFGRDAMPNAHTKIQGGAFENNFRLTEPGEYWADLGFYAEYGLATTAKTPDAVEFGPLVQKDIGRTTQTVNLFLSKEIGPNQDQHGYDFSYALQSRWNIWRQASPALEIYGDTGPIDHTEKFEDQQLLVGPVILGNFFVGSLGQLKYEAGYLVGATRATADGTVRWRLELEIPL